MWWLRRSISRTSAPACRSACAAAIPAKPPPMMTTRLRSRRGASTAACAASGRVSANIALIGSLLRACRSLLACRRRSRHGSAHRPFLIDPETFPQGPLQYLARPALRQLGFRELEAARNLVVGEKPPAVGDQFVRAKSLSRLAHDAGGDELTPLPVGDAEDRRFENRRMLVDDGFDLAGVDVFATGDDHVLRAVENVEIALGIAVAHVAGTEHPVLERAARLLRILPVAAHDIGAARHQFTMLPGFNLPALFVHDPHIDPGTGSPTGCEPRLRVLIVLQAGQKA